MIEIEQNNIKEIAEYLKQGKLVAIPTETVYGIAVAFGNVSSIQRLKDAKEREDKPFSLMLKSINRINDFAYINPLAKKIIDNFLPGELTIVLDKKDSISDDITAGFSTVGIRVPNDSFLKNLISLTGPLVVTSANKKGENSCLSSDEVKEKLDFLDIVVKGICLNTIPTTVAAVNEEEIKVLREGRITLEDLNKIK